MSEWFHQAAESADRFDRVAQRRVAGLPEGPADLAFKRLSRSANHSLLWFAVAAVLAGRAGATRRGALRGLVAILGASTAANAVLKPLLPRRRPPDADLPPGRRLRRRPTSSSFPSGHAASAAAFATAVAMESPRAGLAVAPLAATVAWSRVRVGVHWSSDVLAGAAVGIGSALLTRRWWPVRTTDQAAARPLDRVPSLDAGAGLLVAVNPYSGDPAVDLTEDVRRAFPAAILLTVTRKRDLAEDLVERLGQADGAIRALGAVGGDGTVATVVALASQRRLPVVLVPGGTLNHFARDVGVYDLQEAVDATGAGEAVAVDLGTVRVYGPDGEPATRYFLNTASLGCYSDLVRLRERWQRRWGKWPAFAAALVAVLRRANPVEVVIDGVTHPLWVLFVGNGPYHPSGMVPAWRSRLDTGLLDVRWLRADVRFSRLRAFFALGLTALGHARVYGQREVSSLDVTVRKPALLATDGEVTDRSTRFVFGVEQGRTPVYRRDEDNPRWAGRDRPHHPW